MQGNRLNIIDPDLSNRLRHASQEQLRSVALGVCEVVLRLTDLKGQAVDSALDALRKGNYDNPKLRKELESTTEKLDEIQWSLQEAREHGEADQSKYLTAFSQARAANTLYFAVNANAFAAATEAIYEANAALGDFELLKKIISNILDH